MKNPRFNPPWMPRRRAVAVVLAVAGGVIVLGWLQVRQRDFERELVDNLVKARRELSVTQGTLTGYRRHTDFFVEGRKAVLGQSRFLGARVVRDFTLHEQLQESVVGIKSDATVAVQYVVEFPVGFDLRPEGFSIDGDGTRIRVTLDRPVLVASPAVQRVTHKILSRGVFTDEKAAVIAIQQRLSLVAEQHHAPEIVRDPAVVALCEKRLAEFLTDFMSKQPGVKFVPAVEFVYR